MTVAQPATNAEPQLPETGLARGGNAHLLTVGGFLRRGERFGHRILFPPGLIALPAALATGVADAAGARAALLGALLTHARPAPAAATPEAAAPA